VSVAQAGAVDEGGALDAARQDLLLPNLDLWYGYFALGGDLPYDAMRAYLAGAATAPSAEHNKLAVVLNERYLDRGANHPVPYLA
jgi:hypothetical protein